WRTVDQDIRELDAVAGIQTRQGITQTKCAIARLADFKLKAGKIESRWCNMQPRHRSRHDRVAQRGLPSQHIVGRIAPIAPIEPEPGRSVALRIEIDDQHVLADGGQCCSKIDRRRRLTDAAFLVSDGKNPWRL